MLTIMHALLPANQSFNFDNIEGGTLIYIGPYSKLLRHTAYVLFNLGFESINVAETKSHHFINFHFTFCESNKLKD